MHSQQFLFFRFRLEQQRVLARKWLFNELVRLGNENACCQLNGSQTCSEKDEGAAC